MCWSGLSPAPIALAGAGPRARRILRRKMRPILQLQAAAASSCPAGVPTPVMETADKPKRPLLSFTLDDLDGHPVKLSKWQGHPLIVDFWATWCPPCRKEIPELNAIYKKYRSKGLVVLGVSVDKIQGDGVKSVRPFAEEFKIGYPILMADDSLVDATDRGQHPHHPVLQSQGKTGRTPGGPRKIRRARRRRQGLVPQLSRAEQSIRPT